MIATTTARAPRTAAATSTAAPTPEPLSTESLRAELARRFAERSDAMARLGPGMAHLWELAAEHAQGGKLLRPRLLLAAHAAMSEATGTTAASESEVLRLASALELLHFAFLLHDDVIDGDLFRRGHLNLVGTLSAGTGSTTCSTTPRTLPTRARARSKVRSCPHGCTARPCGPRRSRPCRSSRSSRGRAGRRRGRGSR